MYFFHCLVSPTSMSTYPHVPIHSIPFYLLYRLIYTLDLFSPDLISRVLYHPRSSSSTVNCMYRPYQRRTPVCDSPNLHIQSNEKKSFTILDPPSPQLPHDRYLTPNFQSHEPQYHRPNGPTRPPTFRQSSRKVIHRFQIPATLHRRRKDPRFPHQDAAIAEFHSHPCFPLR